MPIVPLNPNHRPGRAAARLIVVGVLSVLLVGQPVASAMGAGGRVEGEPSSAELDQQQARVAQLRADQERQAAAVDDAQGALRAAALLAGQALEDYSTTVRALQARQLVEQQTQATLEQAQAAADASRRELGRWARQAYQGGNGLGGNATLNALLLANGAQDFGANLVALQRIGRDRGLALVEVQRTQGLANAAADVAATASEGAASAAIEASTARAAADRAVNVQRRLLGVAETSLAQTKTDATAAARQADDLRAANALAQAQRAGSGANRDNRVTGPVGSCTGAGRAQFPSGAVLGGGVVDESPIYALLTNSRLNPIDFLCSTNQFHEASQHLTSHAKSSPSSCPSPTHPPTYPNT